MGHRTGEGLRTDCEALNATLRNLDFIWGQWEAMRFPRECFREVTLPEAASGDVGHEEAGREPSGVSPRLRRLEFPSSS